MPVNSFNETVNAALTVFAFRAVRHVEQRLKVRFVKAVLEFIVDEREQPHFLWPKELIVVDLPSSGSGSSGILEGPGSAVMGAGGSQEDAGGQMQPYGAQAMNDRIANYAVQASAGAGMSGAGGEWLPSSLEMSGTLHGGAGGAGGAGGPELSMHDEYQRFLGNTTGSGNRGYILLVDNDTPAALTTIHALTTEGFAVTLVDDGPKALALTRANAYDCLLIGRDLPTLSGLEVSRIIRQREATIARSKGATDGAGAGSTRLPIIVLTSRTAPVDLQLYREVGISGCVSKPVFPEALVKTVMVAVPNATRSQANMTLQTPAAERKIDFGGPGGPEEADEYQHQHYGQQQQQQGGYDQSGGLVLPHIDPAGRPGSASYQGQGGMSPTKMQSAGRSRAATLNGGPPSPTRGPSGGVVPGGLASPYAVPQTSMMSPAGPARTPRASGGPAATRAGAMSGAIVPYGSDPNGSYSPTGADGGFGGNDGSNSPTGGGTMTKARSPPRPVTGGPHGGRLGQGGGLPIHPPNGAANSVGPPAPATLPPSKIVEATNDVTLGTFRFDAETEVPYCVMGTKRPGTSFFHLVIIHDFFDTYERYQLFFRRMTTNLPGLRILLFNYPGQAFTQFRKDIVLNNEYLAGFTQALMIHLGAAGNKLFDLDDGEAPFFMCGYGNGASVALAFAAKYCDVYPNLRGLTLINGFATPDAHLAGVLHDCINVFSCTPPQRPDLPVYFYARFLFSAPYLEKVGAPLALNMYTAISNPITLEGRIALAQGALNHINVFNDLKRMDIPIIAVAASRDSFVKFGHATALAKARGGEARSIRRTLYSKRYAAIVSIPSGHEVWQEAKNTMTNLFVQLVTGYHEKNDVAFVPMEESEIALLSKEADTVAASQAAGQLSKAKVGAAAQATSKLKHMIGETTKAGGLMLEDRFLEHVVTSMRNPQVLRLYPDDPISAIHAETTMEPTAAGIAAAGTVPLVPNSAVNAIAPRRLDNQQLAKADVMAKLIPDMRFGQHSMAALPDAPVGSKAYNAAQRAAAAGGGHGAHIGADGKVLTASQMAADEARKALPPLRRMDAEEGRVVAGRLGRLGTEAKGGAAQMASVLRVARNARTGNLSKSGLASAADMPEVQEYMKWRVIRNRRRLQRIEACCVVIQRAFRSYLARTAVRRIVEHRAALDVQRFWRGVMGRAYAAEVKRIVHAARAIQRVFRGHRVRLVARRMRVERDAAVDIQRVWKGHAVRKFVRALKLRFKNAAIKIQACWRRFLALKELVRRRIERLAAITMQRVARGFLARKKAARERERFLFSKSQAQGIEFGRQLLMEHKLRATRLQSEVSMLTREKVQTEEQIQAVLAEIASFEQGVRQLERDMLQLSRADAEIAVAIDEDAKAELRENKLRLDREFSAMLAKIADRREQLNSLEAKLQSLDRARGGKREELRDLERKLVVLLEQQQAELQAIRRRQEVRREHLVEDAVEAVAKVMTGASVPAISAGKGLNGGQLALTNGEGGNMTALINAADSPMTKMYGVDPVTNAVMNRGGGGGGGGGTMDFNDLPHAGSNRMSSALVPGGQVNNGGPTPQQRAEAAALMTSTETMMKFGFMAMSLTYFSSLNMVRAMKHVGAANTITATNPLLSMLAQMGASGMAGGNPAAALAGGAGGNAIMPGAGATGLAPFGGQDLSGAGAPGKPFKTPLKPGQLPGEESVDVSLWTVADVCGWLETLMLGQYKDSFADAAVDGPFLLELTEDDLLNTLGVEHALHRKKIIASILRLRKEVEHTQMKEAVREQAQLAQQIAQNSGAAGGAGAAMMQMMGSPGGMSMMPGSPVMMQMGNGSPVSPMQTMMMPGSPNPMMMASMGGGGMMSPMMSPMMGGAMTGTVSAGADAKAQTLGGVASLAVLDAQKAEAVALDRARSKDAGLLKMDDLVSWIRHNKGKQVAEALAVLPDGRFKTDMIKSPYVPGFGTEYVSSLDGLAFHVNKTDEHGNTLLMVAAQNNRLKMAQLLIRKGSNPNHQNAQGNTAMHFAMSYKFHDLAAWLVDPEKGGASDEVHNQHGLDPYEGLEP